MKLSNHLTSLTLLAAVLATATMVTLPALARSFA